MGILEAMEDFVARLLMDGEPNPQVLLLSPSDFSDFQQSVSYGPLRSGRYRYMSMFVGRGSAKRIDNLPRQRGEE